MALAVQRHIHGIGMAAQVAACLIQHHLMAAVEEIRAGQAADAGPDYGDTLWCRSHSLWVCVGRFSTGVLILLLINQNATD
jgi:hypothetical protein